MDHLDQVLEAATPLLRRAERVLDAAGAPAEHEIWQELRCVRLLPADAVEAVAALRPGALSEAVPELRSAARSCAGAAADLPPPGDWEGEAAEAYDDLRHRVAAHLAGADDSLDERLEATADLADALSDWMTRARDALAATLAEVLLSTEALTLQISPAASPPEHPEPPEPAEIEAAAAVAAHVLRVIAGLYTEAEELMHNSTHLTKPIPV
ncbi:hypothetical protein [Paractinoplanes atraurantiacus]|uniref:Uncharacterized protein n=1 Tax=Paractinoplanes atraurantiacus TaxID=1036182 RepID=A0A285KF12_9ACTN|nr:hypothetical protein [Actinoplanes atraurantiacus]SNY70823.1 hypothetical protein SAMN05421748_13865 [Actinoplanes atraurantiacus]